MSETMYPKLLFEHTHLRIHQKDEYFMNFPPPPPSPSSPIQSSSSSSTITPPPSSSSSSTKISPAVLFIIVVLAVLFFISGLLHLLVRFLIKHPSSSSSAQSNRQHHNEISTSGLGSSKSKTVANVSHGSPQILDGEVAFSASKATPKRKARQSSNKAAGKESARRGSRVKNASPAIQSEKSDVSTKASHSPSPGFKLMHSNEVQQYGHADSNGAKAFSIINTSTSSLPDLNTSASPPVLFHQPFTDLQQVQLCAQIFVYGALIQGTIPEEAHMISAYGVTDGGRNTWENVWRACMERQLSQKSHPVNPETPLQSRFVARTPDTTVKQSELQGKVISSPLGRASSKATASIANPPCHHLTRSATAPSSMQI